MSNRLCRPAKPPQPRLQGLTPLSRVSKRPSLDKSVLELGLMCQWHHTAFPGLPILGKLLTRIMTVQARRRSTIIAIRLR